MRRLIIVSLLVVLGFVFLPETSQAQYNCYRCGGSNDVMCLLPLIQGWTQCESNPAECYCMEFGDDCYIQQWCSPYCYSDIKQTPNGKKRQSIRFASKGPQAKSRRAPVRGAISAGG